MKLSKKLIPAIGMLMLSAVMLVTSSFAWFSMNDKVVATGMKVTAVSEEVYLQIAVKSGTESSFIDGLDQTTADAKMQDAAEIKPVSIKGFSSTSSTINWITNYSTDKNQSTAAGTDISVSTDLTSYVLKQDFEVRLSPTAGASVAGGPLRATSVVLSANESELAHAVSVLIVSGNNAQWFKQNADGTAWTNEGDALSSDPFTSVDGAPTTVSVYVFFDGAHPDCTSKNLLDAATANEYSVTVNFTVAKLASQN